MSDNHNQSNGGEERVDELARTAGAALRRPAPADGMGRVRSSQRRRQTGLLVAGGSAVILIVVGVVVLLNRNSDSSSVVTDSTTDITSPEATTTTTTEPPTTTTATSAPAQSLWQATTEQFPQLTYIACCGTNWEGEPSPAVPGDPAAPLAPGIYNVRAVNDDQPASDVLALEVRPYVKCNDLGQFECSGDAPYADTDLGVPTDPARTVDLKLDDSVRVAMSGYACENDSLQTDTQIGTGTDLATLSAELDEAYETFVGAPLRSGVSAEQLAVELPTNPASGFFDPGCPSYPHLGWQPSSGPAVLAISLTRLDAANVPQALPSASAQWITPTAISVDENGDYTLYVYAGFLS